MQLFLGGNIDGLLLDVVGDVLDLDVDSTFVWDDLDLDDVVVALAARRTHLKIIRCKFLTNFILHQMLETNQIIPSLCHSYLLTSVLVNSRPTYRICDIVTDLNVNNQLKYVLLI